jgi:hypothetical protein
MEGSPPPRRVQVINDRTGRGPGHHPRLTQKLEQLESRMDELPSGLPQVLTG